MDTTRIRGMRSRVPGVLLVAVLALVVLLPCFLLLSSYREQMAKAETGTRNLAALLQTQLYDLLRRTDADLAALAAEIPREAFDAASARRYEAAVGAQLSSRLKNVEHVSGLHVHDAAGVILYSSVRTPQPPPSVADREYFRKLRVETDAGMVFSGVVRSRVSGEDVVVAARGARDGEGRFLGGVFSTLALESFSRQFAALELGKRGFVALRRSDDHTLLVRWPPDSQAGETRLAPDHPFVRAFAEGGRALMLNGSSVFDPAMAGHVVSLKGMPDYPFYFVVGFDRDEVLAGWYIQAAIVAVTLLAAVILIGTLLRRLGRMREREGAILADLAKSESQFADLAQIVPVGISRFDAAGRCVYVNDRALHISGRERDALIGSKWWTFVHPGDRAVARENWNDRKGEGPLGEYRLVRPGGEAVYVIGEAKAERRPDGVLTGYILAQTDISLLKRVQAELMSAKQQAEQSNQAKTRFLATASHDLRQPIQAINLFKDALCRTDLDPEQQTLARFLSLSVRSLSDLLYSLLDISKLDAGLVRPQMKEVEVEELFKAVDEEFSTLARQQNLRFKFFYPINSPVLHTDSALLLSVLRNLIDNAFKYTTTGGVLVGFRKKRGVGVVQVWDTGIGIDPAFGDEIFEECFQVGNPAGDRSKGLGIGLSIARRTARLLGGDVTYRSRPGKGSVFEIAVPLGRGAAMPKESAGAAGEPFPADVDCSRFAGWRVVVVEDDPVVAKSVELSLQAVGMRVDRFASAEEAMASPSLLDADFYISDFVLPGMNGIELLDAVRQRSGCAVRAVLMTGETAPERMDLAKGSCWNTLFKPTGLAGLLSIMHDIVAAEAGERAEAAGGK